MLKELPGSLKDARKERDRVRAMPMKMHEELAVLRHKFHTAAWKLVSYGMIHLLLINTMIITIILLVFLSAFGYWAMSKGSWMWQLDRYYDLDTSPELYLYYLLGISYYVYSTLMVFHEPRMKDRTQLMVHHIATLTLLVSSNWADRRRYGGIIMLLHDISDPFMEASKLGLYLDWPLLSTLAFPTFAAVFIYTRNWLFPRYIVRKVWEHRTYYQYWTPTFLCLCTLAVLHVYWSFLILKILFLHVIRGETRGDIREED